MKKRWVEYQGSRELHIVAEDGRILKILNARGYGHNPETGEAGWDPHVGEKEFDFLTKQEATWSRMIKLASIYGISLDAIEQGGAGNHRLRFWIPGKGAVEFRLRTESNVWIPKTVTRRSWEDGSADGMRGDFRVSGGYNLREVYSFPSIAGVTTPGHRWEETEAKYFEEALSLLEECSPESVDEKPAEPAKEQVQEAKTEPKPSRKSSPKTGTLGDAFGDVFSQLKF